MIMHLKEIIYKNKLCIIIHKDALLQKNIYMAIKHLHYEVLVKNCCGNIPLKADSLP